LIAELCYIDGLVSTGNQIPYTILKINFPIKKIFSGNFINIFFYAVDKASIISLVATTELKRIHTAYTYCFVQRYFVHRLKVLNSQHYRRNDLTCFYFLLKFLMNGCFPGFIL
jgi:hypothetical protein